jgi:hypothetical protein
VYLVDFRIKNPTIGVRHCKCRTAGGTVCFLAIGNEGKNAVCAIHQQYQQEVKKSAIIFEAKFTP